MQTNVSFNAVHNKINEKIDLGIEICKLGYRLLKHNKKKKRFAMILKEEKKKLRNIDLEYNQNTAKLFICDSNNNINECYNIINKMRLNNIFDEIINKIKYVLDANTNIANKNGLYMILMRMKNVFVLDYDSKKHQIDTCDCGNTMEYISELSRMICNKCGFYILIEDTAINNSEEIHGINKKIKLENKKTTRHCETWIDRIQAKKTKKIPEKHFKKIQESVNKTYIRIDAFGNFSERSTKFITCEEIRTLLKEINLTEYNDYVPYIRKLLTGIVPYQFTIEEESMILTKFIKAMEIFDNELKYKFGRSSRLYYPYVLLKIIEYYFPKGSKQRSLLECIHIQNDDTLIKNDEIWKEICKDINGIESIPTNRNLIAMELISESKFL
jgi:hypothetical protein